MYIPMFPWNVFRVNLIDKGLITPEQMRAMQKECYAMRKADPVGRARSNNGSGWQSNDGVNEKPIFSSMMNGVEEIGVAAELQGVAGRIVLAFRIRKEGIPPAFCLPRLEPRAPCSVFHGFFGGTPRLVHLAPLRPLRWLGHLCMLMQLIAAALYWGNRLIRRG